MTLEEWIFNREISPNTPVDQMLGMLIFQWINRRNAMFEMESGEAQRHFYGFQNLLATEYVCRRVGAKLRPVKICDFTTYHTSPHISMKSKQLTKFNMIAASLYYLRNQKSIIL